MSCLPCLQAAMASGKHEKLEDAKKRAQIFGQGRKAAIVCIYEAKNGYGLFAKGDPDHAHRTIIYHVLVDIET